jgi:hypothetical protein
VKIDHRQQWLALINSLICIRNIAAHDSAQYCHIQGTEKYIFEQPNLTYDRLKKIKDKQQCYFE